MPKSIAPDTISGILEILNRLYLEILEIEERFSLQFGKGDFRPRIEYFHDAVRAFTSREAEAYEPGGRLSVEMLSYDVVCLRYLQTMPLASIHTGGHPRSPHQGLVAESADKALSAVKPDRLTKIRLSELYQQYGVLFSALFKPQADQNFQERADELNELVSQLARVAQLMESKAPPRDVRDAVAHLDHPKLREALLSSLQKQPKKDLKGVIHKASQQVDSELAVLDKAHFQYASAQLGMFEEGRDIIKKLAARGMNLAGQFVADAMAQAQAQMGRG